MCLKNKIQQTLAEIAERQERLAKLEKLESATAPIKNSLVELLGDYSDAAPEELPEIWQEILAIGQELNLAVQPLTSEELQQWEAANAENEKLKADLYWRDAQIDKLEATLRDFRSQIPTPIIRAEYELATGNDASELSEAQCQQQLEVWEKEAIRPELEKLYQEALVEPEYEPDEAYDTVESILKANGFFQPDADIPVDWDNSELYENYRGWDIFYSFPNGGIVAIGLNNSESNQFWDADTEYIQEIEGNTFPESLGDYDEIVAWTKQLIDQVVAATPVESFEIPGQLSLELYDPVQAAREEEELGCNWEDETESEAVPEQLTELQKLLTGNSNFTFEELGVSVAIQSVIAPADDIVDFESEEALITVSDVEGKTREYYVNAQTFLYQYKGNVRQSALGHANFFLTDLKQDAENKKKIAVWNAETVERLMPPAMAERVLTLIVDEAEQLETKVVEVPTQILDFEVMGCCCMVYPQHSGNNLVGATFRFLSLEEKHVDGKPKLVHSKSLLAAEMGDRDYRAIASDLIKDYRDKEALRLEKLANPYATEEDKIVELVKITNCVGYLKQRDNGEINGEILAGYAAFSNKKDDGIKTETQAKARAQKWAEWLKRTYQLECDAPRIAKRMNSENSKQPFAYEVKIKKVSVGQLVKLAEKDLSLLPLELEDKQARSELAHSELKSDIQSAETIPTDRKFLTENDLTIVELIQKALLKFDAELIKSTNVTAWKIADRTRVWNALTEEEQKVYELLLKLEFAQAPDFSVKTPEFITTVDGKQGKSVFLSLRAIDGVSSRVWRYQGQTGDGGYPCKEAAAVAAWLQ